MMAWTHAMIGAAAGSRCETPAAAFTAGVVTHGIADLIPHRDYDINVEVPLLLVVLVAIALRYGVSSTRFWGAVGGFSPDIENGLELLGFLSGTVYPTHTKYSWFIGHGERISSPVPQIFIGLICLWFAETNGKANG